MPTLEDVLRDFESRLTSLEAKVNGRASSTEMPRAAATIPPASTFQPEAAKVVSAHSDSSSRQASKGTGSFFGLVGIAFLVLAAVFFLKLTIDSGWLTPARQVLLAALFGLSCLLLPHFVRRLEDDYGALLSGAGAAILHITWLGAYALHGLISSDAALVLASCVGVLSILLNANIGNAVFVLVAVAGTYLSAPLIGFKTGDYAALSSFFLIWNVSFSALSFALKRRDVLLIAATFAVLTVGLFSITQHPLLPSLAYTFLVLQSLQFAVFAFAFLAYTLHHRTPLPADQAWLLSLLLLIYYATIYSLLDILMPDAAPWIGVGFSLGVLALFRIAGKFLNADLPSSTAVNTFATLALVHSLYLKITPDDAKPLFSLVLALALAALYQRPASSAWGPSKLVIIAVIGYGALTTFIGQGSAELVLLYHFAYGAAALAIAFALAAKSRASKTRDISLGAIILGFAHLEMLCGLYRLSLKVEMSGSIFVSISWGLYALAVLLLALGKRDKVIGQSAVLILAAVSIKAALYDVLATGNLVRVLSLLFAGILLYVCGWVFQRMQAWE